MTIPKKAAKKTLKSWLHNRTYSNKTKMIKELTQAIEQRTAPIIGTMFRKYDPVQRTANKMLEQVQDYVADRGVHPSVLPYAQRTVIENLSSAFCGVIRDHERTMHTQCYKYVYSPTDFFDSGNEELDALVQQLVVEYRQDVADIESIDSMWNEMEAVIKAAPNGRLAYRDLVALGIDLSDYAAMNTLPAVVKLSGNVELINKG